MSLARLGGFEFDSGALLLSKAGRRVHLPAQSAKLLALLVQRAPDVVTRQEIRRALWGDDLHVEFDSAVHACISQIRSALGDNARAPRFIETVPRRGYRCLIESSVAAAPPEGGLRAADAAPALTGPPAPVSTHSGAWLFSLGAVIVALVWMAAPSARAKGSSSLVATQKYERGVSGLTDASPRDLLDRVKHLQVAIESDPDFAAAYAGLADVKLLIGAYRAEPPTVAYAAAKAAAQKAIDLDPSLAEAHAAFGAAVLNFEWDWTTAREHLRRAVALDARSPRAQLWWSRYLTAAGEHPDAIAAARRAVALAPGSPSAMTQLGIAQYYAGRFDDARSSCGTAGDLMREFVPARACAEALASGDRQSPNLLLGPAINFIRNGDREAAIDRLQRAANRRSDSLLLASVEPALDPLRDDPRFTAVLQRLGRP